MQPVTKIIGGLAIGSAVAAGVALAGPESTAPEQISDVLCLRKLALDLTHRGPTEEELAKITSGKLPMFIAALMPRWKATPAAIANVRSRGWSHGDRTSRANAPSNAIVPHVAARTTALASARLVAQSLVNTCGTESA